MLYRNGDEWPRINEKAVSEATIPMKGEFQMSRTPENDKAMTSAERMQRTRDLQKKEDAEALKDLKSASDKTLARLLLKKITEQERLNRKLRLENEKIYIAIIKELNSRYI